MSIKKYTQDIIEAAENITQAANKIKNYTPEEPKEPEDPVKDFKAKFIAPNRIEYS